MRIEEHSATQQTSDPVRSEPIAPAAWADLPARMLMSVLFLMSGFGKLAVVNTTEAYMKAFGVPAVLIWPAAALEIVGGILILFGVFTWPVAVLLAGWCLLTAVIFHTAFSDQNQMINFMKNLAMAGGFIFLARHGARTLAVDCLLPRRRRA